MNCNRCGNEVPETDLAARKAYKAKDGRTFCASCTALLIAHQKAAKAKAQAGQTQGAPAQPKPVQKQPTVQAAPRTQKPVPPPVTEEVADETPQAQERKPRGSQISRAKYKTAAAAEVPEETLELRKAKKKKNLYILIGMAVVIFGLAAIFISMQMSKAKKETQDKTLSILRSKATSAYAKADPLVEGYDTKAMDDGFEAFQKAVSNLEDYAKGIDKLDSITKAMETHNENIKKMEKRIIERKGKIAQEDALEKTLADIESKVTNPDNVEAAFKTIAEMKQKGKDQGFSKDFLSRLDAIEQKGQELYVKKVFESAKKFREEQPTDFDTSRSKFIDVLKRQRQMELYWRQEKEIVSSKEKASKESENKPVIPVSSKQIQEYIDTLMKNIDECLDILKQIGLAKDTAENAQEGERDLLDEKYSKLWKKVGNFEVTRGADNSLEIAVGDRKAGEMSTYYIGEEYAWKDVTMDIEFTILGGAGFSILGRYYNEVYSQAPDFMAVFGLPWGFNFDVRKEDMGTELTFARVLEATGGRLKISGEGLDPDDKNNNRNIESSRMSKMGGIGIDFKPNSKVVIRKFKVKVDK
jgi:hypothetical protein